MKANEAVSCRDSMFEHAAIRLSCGSPRNDSPSRYALITAAGVPMPDSLTLSCNRDPELTLFLGVFGALDAFRHRLRASWTCPWQREGLQCGCTENFYSSIR